MTYIEFYGLPGSGKSLLCKELSKKFGYEVRPTSKEKSRIKIFSYSFCKALIAVTTLKLILLKYAIKSHSLFSMFGFLKAQFVNYYYCYYAETSKKPFLSPHGFIQTLCQNDKIRRLLISNRNLLNNIIKKIPHKNTTYIYLDVPLNISLLRLKKRGAGASFEEYVKKTAAEYTKLFKLLDKTRIEKIRVNATESINKIEFGLMNKIMP